MQKTIAFFVFEGYEMLDLAGPLCAFQTANRLASDAPYKMVLASAHGGLVRNSFGLSFPTLRAGFRKFNTLIVVGGPVRNIPDASQVAAIRKQAKHTHRIASVCTGAFALARAGLLIGKRATTHWRFAAQLQKEHPEVNVESDAIYIKDKTTWTSAGITAGMDLALALIQEDLGLELSRATAQEMVLYHRRPGGQSQFSTLTQMAPESSRMQQALGYIREHLHQPLSTEDLAKTAHLSLRQFGRIFRNETGETPAKAVERIRAEVAYMLIEDTDEAIETIAQKVGFKDPERMRRAFLRIYAHPPQGIRRNARSARERAKQNHPA